jgi:hypothetical protein
MNEKTKDRLLQLQELIKEKEMIEKKIEALLSPEKEVVLPPDFSINAEILTVLKEAGVNGMPKSYLLKKLQLKYPNYGIDRRRVASALAYLKNTKKQIEILGRGMYRAVEIT